MSNQENTSFGDYAFLENRSIHELEELLHIALQDTSADEAYLDALEAAILRCESTQPTGRLSDADSAWDRFSSLYLAGDPDKFALSDEVDLPEPVIPFNKNRQPRRARRVHRALLIAAVVALVITLLLLPALGHRDIFHMVAQWTDESFRLVPPSYGSSETPAYESNGNVNLKNVTALMRSLKDYELPLSLAPKWFPEDRHMSHEEFRKAENGKIYFTATLADDNNSREISFALTKYPPESEPLPSSTLLENNGGDVIEFVYNDITHYITTKKGLVNAVWYIDPFEISIGGHISIDDAKAIITSIYEG